MSRSLGRPSRSGATRRHASDRMPEIWATAVILLVAVGSLGLLSLVAPGVGAPGTLASSPTSSGARSAQDPATHGDLVVTSGETYVIQPTLAGPTYYQGGNITVESGGTLIVRNVTLSFVQYVANTGTAEQRLSHIYYFHDAGTVDFYHANLTTDVQIINEYAKLNLTVTGVLDSWSSTFAFPGWFYINGAGADVTLNESVVTWNAAVQSLAPPVEPGAIYEDTVWAPTISVLGGAQLNLFASHIEHAYADNTAIYGFARPVPLVFSDPTGYILGAGSSFAFPVQQSSDAANLTLDWEYPAAGALSGYAFVSFSGSSVGSTTVSVSAVYGGTSYLLQSSVTLPASTVGTLEVPFTTPLLTAITAGGMLQYLNNTGDFGVTGVIDVTIDDTGTVPANLTELGFQLNTTGPTYDDSVSGPGSVLSAVDSSLGFNWGLYNATPGAAYSQVAPYPWNSNKLLFTDHAVGYLANITTPSAITGVFGASAILPDATSQVNLYRWAQFNLTGRGGVLPIQGATLSAYYAYNSNQLNNATTTTLNDLASTDPAIWGYLQYWDSFHGVSSYGVSNAAGQAFLLLASGNLTAASLPDGIFLGGYHIGISVPAVGVGDHWFNWSVSPYPTGVANATPHFGTPDFAPPQGFPDYYGAVTVASVSVLANGVASTSVDIGQVLGLKVRATDAGTATVTQIGANLYYNSSLLPIALVASYEVTTLDLVAPGEQVNFTLSWVVNDTVTGLHGWFLHNLTVLLDWNYNIPSLAGGNLTRNVSLEIAPSMIAFTAFSLPPTTLNLNQAYISTGTVVYNGSQAATIELFATPVGGVVPIEIAATVSLPGSFTMPWASLQSLLSPGTSYTLTATAVYNHRETNKTLGTYTVPKSPTSPTSFFFQTFFGLPFWMWLAIAAIAVVAIVLFLLFARRQAAGKLVECGECGNLIPEDATVCPKCGAEFESDLIRCSRCASTIPADSKFCPECAAQLLGKPGEAESDPEKQAYADFTEKYRAEAKRELGDNYTEGAFWDWWKRQPTYTPFSQWSLQQGQGTARAGMTAPPAYTETTPETPTGRTPPPRGGAPGRAEGAGAAAAPRPKPQAPAPAQPPTTTVPPAAAGGAGLKACPSCGKEIPAEYLVCPFCNAVTQ